MGNDGVSKCIKKRHWSNIESLECTTNGIKLDCSSFFWTWQYQWVFLHRYGHHLSVFIVSVMFVSIKTSWRSHPQGFIHEPDAFSDYECIMDIDLFHLLFSLFYILWILDSSNSSIVCGGKVCPGRPKDRMPTI